MPKHKLWIWVPILTMAIFSDLFTRVLSNASAKQIEDYRIVIFKEEGFPSAGLPEGLTPDWIGTNLKKQNYNVSYAGAIELSGQSFLDPDKIDLFVLPYGEAFPLQAYDSIRNYLETGGGLFTVSGKPFWRPMNKIDGIWLEADAKPYEDFMAKLGIKYYQSEIPPSFCEVTAGFMKGSVKSQLFSKANLGLTVTTSDKTAAITPFYGNVFAYQIPCRDFFPLIKSSGASDEPVAYPAIFVKSWRNPYRRRANIPNKWCLISLEGRAHPLDPTKPQARIFLNDIMYYLSNKVMIHSLETNYACYRQAEPVTFEAKALNYGNKQKKLRVIFILRDSSGKIAHKCAKNICLAPQAETAIGDVWTPGKFLSDFYTIEAILVDKGRQIDKTAAAFVVRNESILKNSPSLTIKGIDFLSAGKKIFISGVNYYGSRSGELLWLRPDILELKEDFVKMQKMGINFIRIHYHHSKWFRDYITQTAKLPLGEYFDVSDKTALPSERSLRILDAVIQIAREHGLIFCMDLFTLVPEEMGEPKGWLGLAERIHDPARVSAQKEFAALLAKRYKDIPGITWDLWNEPRLENKQDVEGLRRWAGQLVKVFRENGDTHPVTIGDDLSFELLDVLDYAAAHSADPEKSIVPDGLGKPFIFQETWNDVGSGLAEELKQAQKLKHDFLAAIQKGAAGFAPWQWTRQARLWNDDCQPERWDDELGLCVHDDGSLKPAGRQYRELIKSIKKE